MSTWGPLRLRHPIIRARAEVLVARQIGQVKEVRFIRRHMLSKTRREFVRIRIACMTVLLVCLDDGDAADNSLLCQQLDGLGELDPNSDWGSLYKLGFSFRVENIKKSRAESVTLICLLFVNLNVSIHDHGYYNLTTWYAGGLAGERKNSGNFGVQGKGHGIRVFDLVRGETKGSWTNWCDLFF